MITELKEVIQKVEQLNDEDQRMIARMLDAELQWDNSLKNTQDKLATLGKEALQEHQLKNTKQDDW